MRININKIICINLASLNAQQLFAICETYFIGFEELYRRKTETKVSMYWMSEEKIVAYVIGGFFRINSNFGPVSLEDQELLKKMKPIKTPKMPKTASALSNYKAFLADGYDIRTPSMDSKLAAIEAAKERSLKIEEEKETKKSLLSILDVDLILEKISEYGISSITKEEKEFLDNQSI